MRSAVGGPLSRPRPRLVTFELARGVGSRTVAKAMGGAPHPRLHGACEGKVDADGRATSLHRRLEGIELLDEDAMGVLDELLARRRSVPAGTTLQIGRAHV